jgi:hypothetical protein
MEELEIKKKYQWTTGPRANQLEVYLAEDDTHIWFESGRNVQKEMMDVHLRQIEDSMYNSLISAQTERERIQGLLGNEQPLTMASLTTEQLGVAPLAPAPSAPDPIVEPKREENPISLILAKQKKLEIVDIKMNMPVEIPSIKVYEFLTMMFDEDEIVDEMTEFVFSQMTQEEIHECIKNSIKSHILSIDSNSGE